MATSNLRRVLGLNLGTTEEVVYRKEIEDSSEAK